MFKWILNKFKSKCTCKKARHFGEYIKNNKYDAYEYIVIGEGSFGKIARCKKCGTWRLFSWIIMINDYGLDKLLEESNSKKLLFNDVVERAKKLAPDKLEIKVIKE